MGKFIFSLSILAALLSASITFGQIQNDGYKASLLIPYNDHGKWGWSDTLGNVKVKPQFDKADFFFKRVINGKEQYWSEVQVNGNENYYVHSSGLLFPKDITYHESFSYTDDNALYFIKRGIKYGLFDADKDKLVVPPRYDEVWTDNKSSIFFKRNGVYSNFNFENEILEKTTLVEIDMWWFDNSGISESIILYKDQDNKWYKDFKDKKTVVTIDDDKWTKDGDMEIAFMEEAFDIDDDPQKKFIRKNDVESGMQKIKYTIDYTKFPIIEERYGFKRLYVVEGENGIGIETEDNKVIVPIENDSLNTITQYGPVLHRGAIYYKNGKAGVKLFFTSYPMTQQKYDYISDYVRSLRVSEQWSFGVYSAKYAGQNVYVGENGVDFFDLD